MVSAVSRYKLILNFAMSHLNDRYDIFSAPIVSKRHVLNEELSLDDLFTATDTRSQDTIADNSEVDNELLDYEHFMRLQFTMPTNVRTPMRIVNAFLNFIPEYIETEIFPILEQSRHISSFTAGWTKMESLTFNAEIIKKYFYLLSQTREFMTETPYALTGRRLQFIILFNVNRPERVRHIFSTLNSLYQVYLRFKNILSSSEPTIDNWPAFILNYSVIDNIKNAEYTDSKNEKAIKHFVDVFTKSKKTKKELAEYMSPRNNYLGTGYNKFDIRVSFLDGTWRNAIFSPNDNAAYSKSPIAFIPEGKTVRCRYWWHDVFVNFRVAGTLIVWHRFDLKTSSGHFTDENYGLQRLDPEYHHNTVVLEIEFDTYPDITDGRQIEISVHDRFIDNLIVRADDTFLEDINQLKSLIHLSDIENVKNIEWEFLEE